MRLSHPVIYGEVTKLGGDTIICRVPFFVLDTCSLMLACPWLNPAARLLLWLMLAIFLQVAALPFLVVVSLLPLLAGAEIRRHWWKLFLRVRLLLLTLFLVFAYAFPSDSASWSWLPAWEGCLEAGQHVLRLLIFLGALAWLLVPLRLAELIGGLWFLLRPFKLLGVPVDRSIARLSLVLLYLENPPVAPDAWQRWKQWLEEGIREEHSLDVAEPVRIFLPLWRGRDHVVLLLAGLSLLLLGHLS
ncbi:MAG: hypothetical protein FWG81_03070 [Betaproteobacteria bacterium]|nr:hypothetical protein [Betaproteobacteria bacterium]